MQKTDIDPQTKKFFDSIEKNDIETFKEMIQNDSSIITKKRRWGSHFQYPLSAAIIKKNFQMVKLLIDSGVKQMDTINEMPDFHRAASSGNLNIVNYLLDHGWNPLTGEEETTNELEFVSQGCGCGAIKHECGKIFKFKQISHYPILHYAVRGKNVLIVDKLITQIGAKIDNEDNDGNTALHIACLEKNLDIVKILVLNGADVNYQTKKEKPVIHSVGSENLFGCTPFHLAVKKKAADVVKFLLDYNPDFNMTNKVWEYTTLSNKTITVKRQSVIENAKEDLDIFILLFPLLKCTNSMYRFHILAYYAEIKEIKECQLNTEFVLESDPIMFSPLHTAVVKGHLWLIQYWMEQLHVKIDNNNIILIQAAVKFNRLLILQYLLTKYVGDPEELSRFLSVAIENENIEILKYLISNGANNVNYNNGEPLKTSWRKCNVEIVKILLNKGADPNVSTIFGNLLFDTYGKFNNNFDFIVKMLIDYGLDLAYVNKKGENIIDYLINNLKMAKQADLQVLIILLSSGYGEITFNLDKLKKTISESKLKEPSYQMKEPTCPYDEMNLRTVQCYETYLPTVEILISKFEECVICMENYSNYSIPKCNHKVVCSKCVQKLNECPKCLIKLE